MYKNICYRTKEKPIAEHEKVQVIELLDSVVCVKTEKDNIFSFNMCGKRLQMSFGKKFDYDFTIDLPDFITNMIRQMLNDGE